MSQCIWPSILSCKLIYHFTPQFDIKLPHSILTLLLLIMSQSCENPFTMARYSIWHFLVLPFNKGSRLSWNSYRQFLCINPSWTKKYMTCFKYWVRSEGMSARAKPARVVVGVFWWTLAACNVRKPGATEIVLQESFVTNMCFFGNFQQSELWNIPAIKTSTDTDRAHWILNSNMQITSYGLRLVQELQLGWCLVQ